MRDLTKMAQLSHCEMESYLGNPEEPRNLWTSVPERRDVGKRERERDEGKEVGGGVTVNLGLSTDL